MAYVYVLRLFKRFQRLIGDFRGVSKRSMGISDCFSRVSRRSRLITLVDSLIPLKPQKSDASEKSQKKEEHMEEAEGFMTTLNGFRSDCRGVKRVLRDDRGVP